MYRASLPIRPKVLSRRQFDDSKSRARAAKQQADFWEWWRVRRATTLQPRDAGAPSGKERLDALKQRVMAEMRDSVLASLLRFLHA